MLVLFQNKKKYVLNVVGQCKHWNKAYMGFFVKNYQNANHYLPVCQGGEDKVGEQCWEQEMRLQRMMYK